MKDPEIIALFDRQTAAAYGTIEKAQDIKVLAAQFSRLLKKYEEVRGPIFLIKMKMRP